MSVLRVRGYALPDGDPVDLYADGDRWTDDPVPGAASPVLLVHTATAPNAALYALPALPPELWIPSLDAAWAASAAITSMYGPGSPLQGDQVPAAPSSDDPVAEVLDRALAHGDEHVIKFSDTALDVYQRTGGPDVLAAAIQAGRLLPSPR